MNRLLLGVLVSFAAVQYSFAQTITYTSHIKPLFDSYGCTSCHGGSGGLFVSPYANLFTTGDHKPVVVAGDTNSVIVKKIKGTAGFGSRMPLGGPAMVAGDLNTIIQWIKNGAPETATSADELADRMLVHSFDLRQNYPNPFNPSTIISYQLPRNAFVTLKVYDALGRQMETLVNRHEDAGIHSVTFNASGLPSGVYFYRLQSGDYRETRRLLLLR